MAALPCFLLSPLTKGWVPKTTRSPTQYLGGSHSERLGVGTSRGNKIIRTLWRSPMRKSLLPYLDIGARRRGSLQLHLFVGASFENGFKFRKENIITIDMLGTITVSYTHLTLPTIYSV